MNQRTYLGKKRQNEPNENKNTTCQNSWNIVNAALREKFVSLNAMC